MHGIRSQCEERDCSGGVSFCWLTLYFLRIDGLFWSNKLEVPYSKVFRELEQNLCDDKLTYCGVLVHQFGGTHVGPPPSFLKKEGHLSDFESQKTPLP